MAGCTSGGAFSFSVPSVMFLPKLRTSTIPPLSEVSSSTGKKNVSLLEQQTRQKKTAIKNTACKRFSIHDNIKKTGISPASQGTGQRFFLSFKKKEQLCPLKVNTTNG